MRENKVLIGFISLCVLVVGCIFLYDYTNIFDVFIKDDEVFEDYVGPEIFEEYVEPENLQYTDEKYFAFDKKTNQILDYDTKGGLDVVIPKKIKGVKVLRIGNYSFMDKGLESVIIPEEVKEVGAYAFMNNNLKEIHIPESVKSIGFRAFESNKITRVNLLNNKLTLEGFVFNINNIQEVIYNDKIESMSVNFFGNKLTVQNIKNYPSDKADDFMYIFYLDYNDEIIKTDEYIFNKTKREIQAYLGNETDVRIPIIIDNTVVERIGPYSFNGKNIEKVTLPNTVKLIDYFAFSNNNIENLVLPSNTETIRAEAFLNNNIKSVVIPSNVKEVYSEAFAKNNIEKLIIEANDIDFKYDSRNIFTNNNLIPENIHIANEEAFKYYWGEMFGYSYGSDVVISNDFIFDKGYRSILKYIGEDKKELVVPSQIEDVEVKRIGESAFEGKNFETVIIEENIDTIKKNAFKNCGIKFLQLPNSIQFVYSGAFENNKLEYLELPNNESFYTGEVFKSNDLKSIKIPSSVKFDPSRKLFNDDDIIGTFFGNTNIKEVIIIGDDKDILDEEWDIMFQVGVDINKVKQ